MKWENWNAVQCKSVGVCVRVCGSECVATKPRSRTMCVCLCLFCFIIKLDFIQQYDISVWNSCDAHISSTSSSYPIESHLVSLKFHHLMHECTRNASFYCHSNAGIVLHLHSLIFGVFISVFLLIFPDNLMSLISWWNCRNWIVALSWAHGWQTTTANCHIIPTICVGKLLIYLLLCNLIEHKNKAREKGFSRMHKRLFDTIKMTATVNRI